MGQADHGDLNRLSRRRAVGLGQPGCQGILVVDIQLHEGHHADNRHAAALFEHDDSRVQDGLVSAEFVDDKALEKCLFLRFQQHLCAQKLGKDAAAVDIARQKHRRAHRLCQAHVDDVVFFQVDLGGTARALDHDDVVLGRKRVVGLQHQRHQALFVGKIFPGVHVAQNLSLYNDLGSRICRRL